jgi:chromosome partitioning protein
MTKRTSKSTLVKVGIRPKLLVLCGSKGGCGKSMLARNLLVAAAQSQIRAVGIDMDRQGTLAKWAERRKKVRVALKECVPADVVTSRVTDWEAALSSIDNASLLIVDTAPSVEENIASVLALCRAASLVLVPTGTFHDDMESVVPWMQTLSDAGVHAAFVINRVNTRTRSFGQARATLLRHGSVCPGEIPQLEDIHQPSAKGLTVLDFDKGRGLEAIEAVWMFTRRELSL